MLRGLIEIPASNTGSLKMIVKLTHAERDTILAALRRWQSYPAAREADLIATDGGKHKPLDNTEIERLCKRITKTERKRDARPSTNGDTNGARIQTN
jgi:hypothetical protein